MFSCIYCFFALFSPVDLEIAANVLVIDYIDDSSSQYHPFHSLMLALDFATVIYCSYFDA